MRFETLKNILCKTHNYSTFEKLIVDVTWDMCAAEYEKLLQDLYNRNNILEKEYNHNKTFNAIARTDGNILRKKLERAVDALQFYESGDEPYLARKALNEIRNMK